MADMGERLAFLRGFLSRPREVASLVPSSRFLERRIGRVIDAGQAQTVVELGPGTGGTTRAVLAEMPADAQLLAVDTNPEFVRRLQAIRDPRLIVAEGSAEDLAAILRAHDLPRPDVIFSGIPFSTMPEETAHQILAEVWRVLAPGGRFMAYQFRDAVLRRGRAIMGEPLVECEWVNLPPMHFYSWDKSGRSGSRRTTGRATAP
ncbi:class I SAM-dependent methyltransferase [Spiribacter insolitus]|uniref:Methyltransferase domain-containing protein n=1 Tax=Spiribacter insolitus TaxID=3122417 RepID=A0ABV3T8S4_9GAMM